MFNVKLKLSLLFPENIFIEFLFVLLPDYIIN